MIVFLFLLYSCGPSVYMSIFSPEESGLNLMKITDESANSVAGNGSTVLNYNYSMPHRLVECARMINLYGQQQGCFLFLLPEMNWHICHL